MSYTLKQILDEVLLLSGMDTETEYAESDIDAVKRLVALANQSATQIALHEWQGLRSRESFTMTSDTEYELPDDFRSFISDTMYATGYAWPADFPADTGNWSYLQSIVGGSGARFHMRMLGGKLQVYQPVSGQEVTYEYLSKHPVLATDGSTTKHRFTLDTDTWRLDDDLIIKDLVWRYKKLLGEDYQVDALEYKAYSDIVKGQDKGAQTLMPNSGGIWNGEPYYNLWQNNSA